MNKILTFCYITTFSLITTACDNGGSSTTPTAPNPKEISTYSSSSIKKSSTSSSSIDKISQEIKHENEAIGRPSYYGECPFPVKWTSLDTSLVPVSSSSSTWTSIEKYRFDPTDTFCDRLDITKPETWTYAVRYTRDNSRDSITSYISYRINNECLLETNNGTFTASPGRHIKKSAVIALGAVSSSACSMNECVSVIDIAASFNKIWQTCLDALQLENVEFYTSFDDIPIDTSIYVDQATYDCQQFSICSD